MSIKVIVSGKRACFTRPEMKAERVSYDVPTPGALEGLLKSIYWKPAMRYVIDRIIVFNPIAFTSVRRNEVKSKVKLGKIKAQMKEAEEVKQGKRDTIITDPRIYTNIGDERTQRASMILKNVRYGVEFHVELTGLRCEREQEECDPLKKHQAEFIRRCRKGQYFRQPCLGCAEFPAEVLLTDSFHLNEVCEENKGRHDLGYMLYRVCFRDGGRPVHGDWEKKVFSDEAESLFYRPIMEDGIIDVARYKEAVTC